MLNGVVTIFKNKIINFKNPKIIFSWLNLMQPILQENKFAQAYESALQK